MNVTQPENTITLSDKDSLAIEEGKQRIMLLDAEEKNLRKMLQSLTQDITKAQALDSFTQKELEKKTVALKTLSTNVSEFEKTIEEEKTEIADLTKQKATILAEIEKERNALDQQAEEVRNRESELKHKETEHNNKQTKLIAETDHLQSIKEKLQKVTQEITI